MGGGGSHKIGGGGVSRGGARERGKIVHVRVSCIDPPPLPPQRLHEKYGAVGLHSSCTRTEAKVDPT